MCVRILLSVILPVFLLIGVGVLLDRRFRLDLPTLSRLNFHAFVPAISFVKLFETDVSPAQLASLGVFTLAHVLALLGICRVLFLHRALRPHATALTLGALFYNAGNYGLPLTLLAFGDRGVGVLATILVVQNVLTFTVGVCLLEHRMRGAGSVARAMLRVPVVWAVAAALALRELHLSPPAQVLTPMRYLADGLVPVALLTLGAQLSRTRLSGHLSALAAGAVVRLVLSPLLAAAMVPLFRFQWPVSAVVVAAAGFPVAVNVYILTAEYGQDGGFASQTILVTTLASALTLSVLLGWLI
ncbi:MAG: AEC family transporter [Armatimonadota bacterium]|nr:AEC family transporter [Armatimonadota bacterium]